MKKVTFNLNKASIVIAGLLILSFFTISEVYAEELEVSEQGNGYQAVESTTDSVQPAEDVIYGERLRTDSAVSAGRASYFYEGLHTQGVIFANNTIINTTPDPNRTSGTPVTIGDDMRIDGEIWRGPSKGTSDDMPLKVSDTIIPTQTATNSIGDSSHYWRNAYFSGTVAVGDISGENVISEENLNVSNSPTAGYVLTYGSDGQFTWTSITGSSDDSSGESILPAGTSGQTMRYGDNGWEASSLIANDGTDIDIGGGFGDSGVTIYGAGGINANGSLSAGSLTTSGMLTVGGTAGISGNIQANGDLTVDGTANLDGSTLFGGGYGSTGATINSTGAITTESTIIADDDVYLGGGYTSSNGGATILDEGYMILQGNIGGTPGMTLPSGSGVKMIWYPEKAAFRAGYVASDQWDDLNIGNYSIAMGISPTASGGGSVAIGTGVEAIGAYSTAMGKYTSANGDSSMAIGEYAKADADMSFVWAGDSACTNTTGSCDLDEESVFAIIGGLCVDDEGGTDCPAVADGDIQADGAITATGFDLAERIDSDEELEAGDVVIIDPNNNEQILKSKESYNSSVIGVISTDPGNILGWENTGNSMLALAGRIPTKANNENGNINRGDLLTTSSQEGYAMRFSLLNPEDAENFEELKSILKENEERRNSILGKALEPCYENECSIVTLLSLQ